jgi:hypothetical protein
MFRTLCITTETLAKFESHLGHCLQLFPQSLQLTSSLPLDPCIMAPLMYFQNSRIMLHRHNLSPSCSPEQRSQAIEQCVHAARDTANVLSRSMLPHVHSQEWEQRFIISATSMLCTHFWRCMLFLLFRHCYEPFFVILRASSTINGTRVVNLCCGRYLSFFLRQLIERYDQSGNLDVEQDEELLVWLSGDLQATTNSWVWGNAETGTHLSRRQKHGRPRHVSIEQDSRDTGRGHSPSWDSMLSEEEQHDWGGWQQIDGSARYLQQLVERRQAAVHDQAQAGISGPGTASGTPTTPGPTLAPINDPSHPSEQKRSRITIANII